MSSHEPCASSRVAPLRKGLRSPAPAARAVNPSGAIVPFREEPAGHEGETAGLFPQTPGAAHALIDNPVLEVRDWVDRADRTLADLTNSPEATVRHHGQLYVHPGTHGRNPDIMAQMSLIAALHDYAKWRGQPVPLERELRKSIDQFYDSKLQTLRRHLPHMDGDGHGEAIDSRHLHHPLLNLGRLALDGDGGARALLLRSVDFTIEAARHFDYHWPIQFEIDDFRIFSATAQCGQTDVGGLYAYVMLQCFELTGERRFLEEARAAIGAAKGLRSNLDHRANLCAWGAAACVRLWRITNALEHLEQSHVYLARFFHDCDMWEAREDAARHPPNHMEVTCRRQASSTAMYECFDSFCAFEIYLRDGGSDLEPATRSLITSYCQYALDRAWHHPHGTLPRRVLAKRIRNGHIDAAPSSPPEEMYPEGDPAGWPRPEIYGAGAAFVFATRSQHRIEGAPFRLFCNQFVRSIERIGEHVLSLQVDGAERCPIDLSVLVLPRRRMPRLRLSTAEGEEMAPVAQSGRRADYRLRAGGRFILGWEPARGRA